MRLWAGLRVLGVGCAALGLWSCTDHGERQEVSNADCVVCHTPEYEATTEPPHAGLFPDTCANCHLTDYWVPAVAVQHDWFLLQNRHLDPRCTECHTVGFAPGDTPSTCYGCHQPAYEATTMPPHVNYPTDCASCHDDAGWVPSTFVHSWPLTGAHRIVACGSCHLGDPPVYMGTPRECVGCHQADYDASPYPGHGAFPTACANCHTTMAWTPALDGAHPESEFPIANGAHQGYECTDCHDPARGASTDGANTDCVGCHEGEHARSRVDDKHREVGDYPFGTSSVNFCLDCHPQGRN